MKRLNAIVSFCGAGGMSVGLGRASFDVRFAFDNDQRSVDTYRNNVGEHVDALDASAVSGAQLLERAGLRPSELDVFSGAPCQGFSKQRRGAAALDDPRNGRCVILRA